MVKFDQIPLDNLHHLSFEKILLDLLRDNVKLVDKINIVSSSDIFAATKCPVGKPSVMVFLHDDIPITNDRNRPSDKQLVDQFWNVVISVENVADCSGEEAKIEAGVIIDEVLCILHNFNYGIKYQNLERTKSPYRPTFKNGVFNFPLMFRIRFNIKGNTNAR
jgi:hypothetical protein